MKKHIRVGTRGSRLALAQTHWVVEKLKECYLDVSFEIVVIKTKGDTISDVPLDKIGDKGLFTKDIEIQLETGAIDFAIHSLKDLPSEMQACFSLSKVPKREDPRDVLVLRDGLNALEDLPYGARIGTGSKRRLFQLQETRPDIVPVPIRGNVETRIQKIQTDELDGVILAAAGLHRLGLKDRVSVYLSIETMIPAPAQGALGLQYRTGDLEIQEMLMSICDDRDDLCVRAERSFLKQIEGSCHIPIGCYVSIREEQLVLNSVYGDEEGTKLYRQQLYGDIHNPEALGERAAIETLKEKRGEARVSLIGGGPGDPDLITVKALERLRNCDVVVYDRLVSPVLLNEVPSTAVKLYVGKASNQHAMKQEEINETLIKLSKRYHHIVRLKGGDPYVFGRGGEEALALKSQGIPFEIIPGITSPISGLAYAGIPITHRGIASSFHVFTGHHQTEKLDLDFNTISKLEGTLVFLMSISSYKEICSKLIAHGKLESTPIAIISNATTGSQVVKVATLGTVSVIEDVLSPAFLAVGEVIRLRDELNWFERLPLFGKRIIVTRTKSQSSDFARKLRHLGACPIEVPTIQRVELAEMNETDFKQQVLTFTQIWFTSEHAVNLFFQKMIRSRMDSRCLSHLKILSIGSMTSKALAKYGIIPDYEPVQFTQEGIVDLMRTQLCSTDHVYLPAAEDARPYLKNEISKICKVTSAAIYKTIPANHDEGVENLKAKLDHADYITFTSASAVQNFFRLLMAAGVTFPTSLKCVSIGPITSQALMSLGIEPAVTASVHTIDGLIASLTQAIKEDFQEEE